MEMHEEEMHSGGSAEEEDDEVVKDILSLKRPERLFSLTSTCGTPDCSSLRSDIEGYTMSPLNGHHNYEDCIKTGNGCVSASGKDGHTRRKFSDYGFLVLSALYAKLLVVLGISLPLSEVISPNIPPSFYMGFYLYLYIGCILFLLYAYLFLISRKGSTISVFQLMFSKEKSALLRHDSLSVDMEPRSCGSFYLRVGAIAFGIGSMIYSGLEFVQFFEFDPNATCYNVIFAIAPIFNMAFTFVQLYFIFLNSKILMYKYHNVARFGLMHMVATNLCVWLLTVILESKFEIMRLGDPFILADHEPNHHGDHHLDHNHTDFDSYHNETHNHSMPVEGLARPTRCRRMRVLGQLVQNISPIMFPCTIQYSLICAAICYIMWKNLKSRRPHHVAAAALASPASCLTVKDCLSVNGLSSHGGSLLVPAVVRRHNHRYRVDCTGSIKGLFTGILILVLVIISVILYFVLVNKPEYRHLAVLLSHWTEISMYLLTTPVPLIAMWRIRNFRYQAQKHVDLDNTLLIFAQVGIYLFSIFGMIGGHLSPDDNWLLVLGYSASRLVQATIQTVFILDASHRTARTSEQAHTRPGRELITFLLVCNFAMWIICTLETGRTDSHPLQLRFYGFWGWTVISRFCSPLAIFFRFHSTVCLCEIWKKIYKPKVERH